MKSWRTTIFGAGGLLVVVANTVSALLDGDPLTNPDWSAVAGVVSIAIGLFFARDNKVTSEAAGAK